MVDKREVELLIRAREIGMKTFDASVDRVRKLQKALDDQVAAAERGETSVKALQGAMTALSSAADDLIRQQGLIDLYRRMSEQLDEAKTKANAAAAAQQAYKEKLDASEKVTRTQTRELNSLTRASEGAAKRVDTLTASMASQAQKLEQAGISVDHLDAAQERLVTSAREIGTALSAAGAAADGYEEHLARLATTQARVADDAAFAKQLAGARELQQASSYVSFWEQALERAEISERSLAEFNGLQKKATEAAKLQEARQYVTWWTQALQEAEDQERRAAATSAFNKMGADAATAANGLRTYTAAAAAASGENSNFARTLQQIIDPAGAARATLSGLETELTRISASIGDGTQPIREYQNEINELGRVQQTILKQAGMVDSYEAQARAVKAAEAAHEEARAAVLAHAAAVRTADEPNEELAASLRQAEAGLEATSRALQQETDKLERLRGPLQQAGIDTNDLANAQARLRAASEVSAVAVGKLDKAMSGQNNRTGKFLGLRPYELQNLGYQINDVFTQLASGTSITQTFAQQAGQIGQIFPGMFSKIIAMGPEIAAVVAILGLLFAALKQTFDLEASARKFTGTLALSADGARYTAQALAELTHELDVYGGSLKDAREVTSAFVKAGADQSSLLELGKTAQDLSDVLGIKLPDAAKLMADGLFKGYEEIVKLDEVTNFLTATELEHIRVLFEAGEAEEARTYAMNIFKDSAQDAADRSRSDWSEAVKSLTNTWDDFLSAIANTQGIRDTIRELTGLINLARQALDLLADIKRDPVTGAEIPRQRPERFIELPKWLNGVEGGGFGLRDDRWGGKYDTSTGPQGSGFTFFDNIQNPYAASAARKRFMAANPTWKQPPKPPVAPAQRPQDAGESERALKAEQRLTAEYDDQRDKVEKVTRADRVRRAEAEAARKAAAAGLDDEATARVKAAAAAAEGAKYDKEQSKKDAASSRRAASAARREESEARALENKRRASENQVLNKIRTMDAQVARNQSASLEDRLAAVRATYDGIFEEIDRYEKLGGKEIGGLPLADVRSHVEENRKLLLQTEQMKFYEEGLAALEKERADRLRVISDRREADLITSEEAYKQALDVQNDLGPKIEKMAGDAETFAKGIRGAEPDPKLEAFIAKMGRIGEAETKTPKRLAPSADTGREAYAADQAKLNGILAQRNDLVSYYAQLVQLGQMTESEATAATKAAYEQTQPLIDAQVGSMLKFLETLRATGAISEETFAQLRNQLQLTSAEAKYLDQTFVQIRDGMNQLFSSSFMTFFNTATESIGAAVAGTKSWEEALKDVGRAALQWVLDFAKGIADMILQMMVMKALKDSGLFDGIAMDIGDASGLIVGSAALGVAGQQLSSATDTLIGAAAGWALVATQIQSAADAMATAAALQLAANSTSMFHEGGVVGSAGGMSRSVSPMVFAGAPRYHSGTPGVGLRPNEQAAILEKGEEVLTADNPRHIRNQGKGGRGGVDPAERFKIVNILDSAEMLSKALSTKMGQKVILNFIRDNPAAVNAALSKG